ncbi:sensor histidine kinase [Herbiconiux flava]|uniref:Sensor-like histidine kinase SenX3 n=1 Tax=Herbiconiux flava TaxID=881268 RepID=A0A852SIT9_9MICO|nr:ATP-binding protein [Herbiconiux flava]NYD69744.1 two-component system CitB family sensor kinase [Herbiconiux flava]GLK16492.1 histidine kinase [Herbiconiux flava]
MATRLQTGERMRGRTLPRRAPFTTQVNRSIVAAMILVSLITVALFALTGFNRLVQQTQESALRVAQSVAETPSVRQAAEAESDRPTPSTDAELVDGTVDDYARAIEQRTGALFVVVTDDTGRRLAHPNPDEIGDPVSTSPDAALAGQETVSWESGTLGDSARAKVPIYGLADPTRVVGEVSVGLPPLEVWSTVLTDALPVGLSTALALGVGAVLAAFITRRLRATTLGLEPEELLSLVQDQQAVLQGVDDGVVGLSVDGVVTVCNDRAASLLGISLPGAVGRAFDSVVTDAGVRERVAGGASSSPAPSSSASSSALAEPLLVAGHLLYVDVHEVRRDARLLGRVVIVRDVTDVEDLTRRLSAVGTLAGALREQRHEFANRIHVVSGLVRAGDTAQALEYLDQVAGHGPVRFPVENAQLVREPYLQAFLGAKAAEAEARGVMLRVGPDADVVGSLVHPEDVTTVLGNLVDNGIDAAARSARTPRWVEVEALRHGDELHLSVMDSGDGAGEPSSTAPAAPPEGPEAVHGHGIGLRLSADVARRHGGRLWLAMAGASDHGAVFCAELHGQFEKEDGS